MSEEYYVI